MKELLQLLGCLGVLALLGVLVTALMVLTYDLFRGRRQIIYPDGLWLEQWKSGTPFSNVWAKVPWNAIREMSLQDGPRPWAWLSMWVRSFFDSETTVSFQGPWDRSWIELRTFRTRVRFHGDQHLLDELSAAREAGLRAGKGMETAGWIKQPMMPKVPL